MLQDKPPSHADTPELSSACCSNTGDKWGCLASVQAAATKAASVLIDKPRTEQAALCLYRRSTRNPVYRFVFNCLYMVSAKECLYMKDVARE